MHSVLKLPTHARSCIAPSGLNFNCCRWPVFRHAHVEVPALTFFRHVGKTDELRALSVGSGGVVACTPMPSLPGNEKPTGQENAT